MILSTNMTTTPNALISDSTHPHQIIACSGIVEKPKSPLNPMRKEKP